MDHHLVHLVVVELVSYSRFNIWRQVHVCCIGQLAKKQLSTPTAQCFYVCFSAYRFAVVFAARERRYDFDLFVPGKRALSRRDA